MRPEHDPKDSVGMRLADIPKGTLETVRAAEYPTDAGGNLGEVRAETDGRGRLTLFPVFPGIDVTYILLQASEAVFRHASSPNVLTLFHCQSGRIGWTMRGGVSVYLGPGDMTVHCAAHCAESVMQLPLGYAEGITVTVDAARLEASCPDLLRASGLGAEALRPFFSEIPAFPVAACPGSECIFTPLYALPPGRREAWLRLKIQELLLWLADLRPAADTFPRYPSYQTEIVRAVRDELTAHPERWPTVAELSRRHFINPSALKTVFKGVYGQPIAAYMRDYRIRTAAGLLRGTDATVAEIAARVGYGAQGKFSAAFRRVYRMLPTEYREACRLGSENQP